MVAVGGGLTSIEHTTSTASTMRTADGSQLSHGAPNQLHVTTSVMGTQLEASLLTSEQVGRCPPARRRTVRAAARAASGGGVMDSFECCVVRCGAALRPRIP